MRSVVDYVLFLAFLSAAVWEAVDHAGTETQ